MNNTLAVGIGLGATAVLGLGVGRVLLGGRLSPATFSATLAKLDEEWTRAAVLLSPPRSSVFGLLEQGLFFVAFWSKAPELAAGWLIFKVGSKWEIWTNIIKMPESPDGVHGFHLRNMFGSWLLQRWLLGTLGNLIAAIVGVGLARWLLAG